MNKFDETVKELKEDIKELEKEFEKRTKGLDKETKQKAKNLVEKAKKVINSSIEKIGAVVKDVKDSEELEELLYKVKAKAKEAVDYTVEKIDSLVNGDSNVLESLHDEIMSDFDQLKDSEIFKNTTVLIKEGYAKINEFLAKPEVKDKIKKAKRTTIDLAEKGVAGLKKVLEEKEEPKKKTKKKAPAKSTKTKKTTKKKATTK